MKELAITATNGITAVGHDGRMTAACVRAGLCRFYKYEDYLDKDDNPITVSQIRGIEDGNLDSDDRMAAIAKLCLENLLSGYFQDNTRRPSQIHLFLGVPSDERDGPRFEERSSYPLQKVIEKRTVKVVSVVVPHGNASMFFGINEAARIIEGNPAAICIVGGIDSLLNKPTLDWFEQAVRLKSESYGRQQGLIAGEAVGFIIVEDPAQAKLANRPALARITGLGLALEPNTRPKNSPSRNSGLTDACREAMKGVQDKEIRSVFCDLNGENSRAKEWAMVDMRCFKERYKGFCKERKLWNPANCYGDIGAASGVLLANTISQGFERNWLESPILLFCSDDHGSCGAMILENA